jgi:hypothetical protein
MVNTTKPQITVEVDEKLYGIGAVKLRCDKDMMAYLKSILMEQEEVAQGLRTCVCDSPQIVIRVRPTTPTSQSKPKPMSVLLGYLAVVVILMAFLIGIFTLIQRHLL